MTDEHQSTANANTTTQRVSDAELSEFRAFRESKIRESAIIEGRAQASAEGMAADVAADKAAMDKLTSRGLTLKNAFGRLSTQRGRDVLANLHRSSFSSQSGEYTRLRRMAQLEGIVQ
jgi:hypothetical protein